MPLTLAPLLLCTVVGISDGDTLTGRCDAQAQTLRIRLAKVDAPEERQAWGKRSRQALVALCFRQQAQIRPQDRDRYICTVAHVRCGGQDAGAAQVEAGLAWAYTRYRPAAELVRLEQQARAQPRPMGRHSAGAALGMAGCSPALSELG